MDYPVPTAGDFNRSVQLLEDLRDASKDPNDALVGMLDLRDGWWAPRSAPMPLMKYARACALKVARQMLFVGLTVDQVDYEGIADEAIMVLGRSAAYIRGNPRAWFNGVIENLVAAELRENGKLLQAFE